MEDASLPFLQQSEKNIRKSTTSQVSGHKVQDETQSPSCIGSHSTDHHKKEKSGTQSNIACTGASTSKSSETQSESQLETDGGDKSQNNDKDRKSSLLEKAPFINFGVDLEHWENPENIKAPVKNKYVLYLLTYLS